VLAPSLDGDGEIAWAQRLVVAGLAAAAEVHLIHLGIDAGALANGRVTTHRVGVGDGRGVGVGRGRREELRRDLLVTEFSAPSDGRGVVGGGGLRERVERDERVDALLPRESDAAWRAAGTLMTELEPDVVVVLDHRDRGVTAALEMVRDVPVTLVPLVDSVAVPGRRHYDALFARADRLAVFSEAEQRVVQTRTEAPVARVELPVDMAAAAGESSNGIGNDRYVVVATNGHAPPGVGPEPFADLITVALPDETVVVVSRGGAVRWHGGRRSELAARTDGPELLGLMAGASVVVDLHPGRFVARRCINAMRLGTPVIVHEQSRAAELCQRGKGGLWFTNAGQLLWTIQSILEPEVGPVLGEQGRRYCDAHHGSFERFAEQLAVACGLGDGLGAATTAGLS
jgi:hypothetical protein